MDTQVIIEIIKTNIPTVLLILTIVLLFGYLFIALFLPERFM